MRSMFFAVLLSAAAPFAALAQTADDFVALCVSDNGTELTSMAILAWCQDSKVGWHYIAPAAYWFRYGGWMLNALPVRSHCIARDNARETEYAIPPSFPMRSFCDMCPH